MFVGETFYRFVGITKGNILLSNTECRSIIEGSVVRFSTNGDKVGKVNRHTASNKGFYDNNVDSLIDNLCDEYLTKINADTSIEVSNIKDLTEYKIQNLEKELNVDKHKISELTNKKEQASTMIEKLEANKELNKLTRGIKEREQRAYLDRLKIEKEMKDWVDSLMRDREISCKWEFVFEVDVR